MQRRRHPDELHIYFTYMANTFLFFFLQSLITTSVLISSAIQIKKFFNEFLVTYSLTVYRSIQTISWLPCPAKSLPFGSHMFKSIAIFLQTAGLFNLFCLFIQLWATTIIKNYCSYLLFENECNNIYIVDSMMILTINIQYILSDTRVCVCVCVCVVVYIRKYAIR